MKLKASNHLRLNAYAVISRAVEEGVAYGWQRAHKHIDNPSPETLRAGIEEAVMNALSEVIHWPENV